MAIASVSLLTAASGNGNQESDVIARGNEIVISRKWALRPTASDLRRWSTVAIDAVHEGGLGDMVTLKDGLISRVPLADVVGRIKPVHEQLWDTANSLFEAPLEQF